MHGGDGVPSKNPQPHRPPISLPAARPSPPPSRTQTLSLSSPVLFLSHLICICFFLRPLVPVPSGVRKDLIFLEEADSEEWWWEAGEILICSWRGKRRRKMAAQEQEQEKQQAKTSTTSSLPSSSERSSSSAPNNLREGGRCRAHASTFQDFLLSLPIFFLLINSAA